MTPWSETEVVVTGLKGGVGALLARDALLRGAKKVWLHHPSSKKTEMNAGDLEVSCGILRASDVGESDVASAFARRLRAYGIVEALGHGALDVDAIPPRAVVFACDAGDGRLLSTVAGLGEEARKSGKRFVFARAREAWSEPCSSIPERRAPRRCIGRCVFFHAAAEAKKKKRAARRPKRPKPRAPRRFTPRSCRPIPKRAGCWKKTAARRSRAARRPSRRGGDGRVSRRVRVSRRRARDRGARGEGNARKRKRKRNAVDALGRAGPSGSERRRLVRRRGRGSNARGGRLRAHPGRVGGFDRKTVGRRARYENRNRHRAIPRFGRVDRRGVPTPARTRARASARRGNAGRRSRARLDSRRGRRSRRYLRRPGRRRRRYRRAPGSARRRSGGPGVRVRRGDVRARRGGGVPGRARACLASEPEARIDGEAFSFSCVVGARGRRDETDGFASPSAIVATGAAAALEVIRRAADRGW